MLRLCLRQAAGPAGALRRGCRAAPGHLGRRTAAERAARGAASGGAAAARSRAPGGRPGLPGRGGPAERWVGAEALGAAGGWAQPPGACPGPQPAQARAMHASSLLRARGSGGLGKRIQDKIQKFRKDENAMQKLMGVGAVGYSAVKMSKFGAVVKFAFPVLKLTKAMPLMSMALSTVCYSCFFGFPFAVGMVSLMFTGQASRALLLKRFGCEVEPMVMIPFFGTSSSGSSDYTKSEEYVLQGQPFKRCLVIISPVVGMFLFTALAPLGVGGMMMGSQCGYAVANTGFWIGMFSLMPMGDMTPGGQLLGFFSRNALLLGTVFNLAACAVLSSPMLYLLFFLNAYRLYRRGFVLFGRQFGGDEEGGDAHQSGLSAHSFTDQQKAAVAAMYWGLLLLNAGGMALVSKSLLSPQTLVAQQREEERQRRLLAPEGEGAAPGGAAEPGWGGLGSWALSSLEAVEEMDRDDLEKELEWQRQLEASRQVPAEELFRQR